MISVSLTSSLHCTSLVLVPTGSPARALAFVQEGVCPQVAEGAALAPGPLLEASFSGELRGQAVCSAHTLCR